MKEGKKQYIVDLRKKVCSCRSWQISSIPYAYACYAIWHDEGEQDEYLDKCYHSNTYIKAYQHALQPINGSHEWKKSKLELVLPLYARKMPGRPKKIRGSQRMNRKKKWVNLVGKDW